jgi:alpha-ketoglutarate-dependent 2,4-dichlorophenoxyacetate dioxygenase
VAVKDFRTPEAQAYMQDFFPAIGADLAALLTFPHPAPTTLYLASHIGRIDGVDEAESRELFDRLMAHATQRQFRYSHRWRVGDLVMWDNRCTMHRGMPCDDLRWPRDFQRATTSDSFEVFENPG